MNVCELNFAVCVEQPVSLVVLCLVIIVSDNITTGHTLAQLAASSRAAVFRTAVSHVRPRFYVPYSIKSIVSLIELCVRSCTPLHAQLRDSSRNVVLQVFCRFCYCSDCGRLL